MDLEQGLELVNQLVFDRTGSFLNAVELAVLKGAWLGQTYETIAETTNYSASYLSRTLSPSLWQLLSATLGESVTKKSFRACVEQLITEQASRVDLPEPKEPEQQEPDQQDLEPKNLNSFLNSPTPANQTLSILASPKVAPKVILPQTPGLPATIATHPMQVPSAYCDWGEAIDVSVFYGRTEELTTLTDWVVQDRCRLVMLLGMGGIGKTALSVKFAQQVQQHFEVVIWRSLRNAPPLEELLKDIMPILSRQQEIDLPETIDEQITRLIQYLQRYRCLLILDNGESILQSGDEVGKYLPQYEDYGQLLYRLAEGSHQSCLLLTSREKPDIAILEGEISLVRTLQIVGLSAGESEGIFSAKNLIGSATDRQFLNNLYRGNPLALKIVTTSICDLFNGNIAEFLQEGTAVFNGIRVLLDQQFNRLSSLEKQVMYWLAINREWITLKTLQSDMVLPLAKARMMETLENLRRRSLIERSTQGFTQQPVVMEYMIEKLIEATYSEICEQSPQLLLTHALLKAQAKDYIRESQLRVIVQPLVNRLLNHFGMRRAIELHLRQILINLQSEAETQPGYGAANVIHFLWQMGADLTGYDFSHLTIRQAYLRDVPLQQVNLAHTHLIDPVFAEPLGNMNQVVISPDGSLVAKVGNDGIICVWQVATGQRVLTLAAHHSFVWKALAFSPDGKFLVSGGYDHLVKRWEVATGQCVQVWNVGNSVLSTAFSPDGQWVAVSTDDNTIQLWKVATGQCIKRLTGHTAQVTGLAFHPQGRLLFSSGVEQTIRVWDLASGAYRHLLTKHTGMAWTIALNPQGTQVASGSTDNTIKLWDVETGACLKTLQGHTSAVNSVAYTYDGKILASGSSDGTIRLWDVQTGQCIKVMLQGDRDVVWSICFGSNNFMLVSGSDNGTLKFWDITTGQCFRTLQGDLIAFRSIEFHPQGNLLVSSSENRQVRLWDVATGRCLKTAAGHTMQVWNVAFHPQGDLFASCDLGGQVNLWQITNQSAAAISSPASGLPEDYEPLSSVECHLKATYKHTHWVQAIAFTASGETLVTGSGDAVIRFWDIQTKTVTKTLSAPGDRIVLALAFHPQGHLLASVSNDPLVRIWDVATSKCHLTLQGHISRNWAVVFHPQGHLLASGGDDHLVKLWDVATGECVITLQQHTSSICSLVFNQDGSLMASSSTDRTIRLWDTTTWQCLQIFKGHEGAVLSIAFQPLAKANAAFSQQQVLASASYDETIRLWDIKTGECLKIIYPERLYEHLNIFGVIGLTPAQKAMLRSLGAIEKEQVKNTEN